jgi:hypothetical protein
VRVQQEALLLHPLLLCSAQHNVLTELLHLHKNNQHLQQHHVLYLQAHRGVRLTVQQLPDLQHLGSTVPFDLQLVLVYQCSDRRSGV